MPKLLGLQKGWSAVVLYKTSLAFSRYHLWYFLPHFLSCPTGVFLVSSQFGVWILAKRWGNKFQFSGLLCSLVDTLVGGFKANFLFCEDSMLPLCHTYTVAGNKSRVWCITRMQIIKDDGRVDKLGWRSMVGTFWEDRGTVLNDHKGTSKGPLHTT